MAQKQSDSERTGNSPVFNLASQDFAATVKKGMDEFATAQSELVGKLQESNRQWLDRFRAEATLTSELASKLTAARSLPDAMTACQEWGSRRFEMMAEDTRHLADDAQKFMQAGAHLFVNPRQSEGSSVSK